MSSSENASENPPATTDCKGLKRHVWLALAAILVLGATLRFADLGGESIWRDEGTSIHLAHQDVGELLRNRAGFNHGPLHFLLLRAWVPVFGDSEASVRTPSAIFGTLAVLLAFAVTLQLFRKSDAAIFAALLMAVSLFQVEYSQEARMYSMLAFLGLAATCCFIRLLRGGSRVWWVLYFLASLLLVHTHLSAWALILVQNAAWIVRRKVSPRPPESSTVGWIVSQALLVALFSPWLWAMMKFDAGLPLTGEFGLGKLRSTFKGHFGGYPLMAAYFVTIAWALVVRLRAGRSASDPGSGRVAGNAATLFTLAWWLAPLAILTTMCILKGTRIMDRYTMIGAIAAFPLAGVGVALLPGRSIRLAALGLFLALSVQPFVEYYAAPQKDDWRAAVAHVEKHAKDNEPVLFLMYRDEWYITTCFDYYAKRDDLDKQAFKYSTKKIPERERLKKFLPDRLRKHPRLWLVRLDVGSWSNYERLFSESGYRMSAKRNFSGLLVTRWDRSPAKTRD